MTRISRSPSYLSSGLARSRERGDFAICGFASRFQGNFIAFCTSATSSTSYHLCSNLLSASLRGHLFDPSQHLGLLQYP